MKKFLAILGLALSAIVLSNNVFANNLIVDTVSVPQRHIKAYNTTDTLTTNTIWYFIFDLDNHTATLTYPRTDFNNINEPFSTSYDFGFVGLEGIWNQNMYNCWSEVIEKKAPGSNDLFYTALRIPEKVKRSNVEYTVTGIGDNAFNGSNINYIDVPKTVKRIGKHAFANSKIIGQCEASPYQVIPDSVYYLGDSIFQNCENLTRIEFGDSVEIIPEGTFEGCFVTDPNSPKFAKTLDIRFGKKLSNILCKIQAPTLKLDDGNDSTENSNKLMPKIRVAFSSPKAPNIDDDNFIPNEVWIPTGKTIADNYKLKFDHLPDSIFYDYFILPESDTCYTYKNQQVKVNFTQKSYFKNPNSVYNYIYYYPAVGGINFSVNALTGRGANKVRFRMLFDSLDHVYQANKVYQIIKQDVATSYSYLTYDSPGDYEVTLRSLDFTRAEAKVVIRVFEGVPAANIQLNGVSSMAVGETAPIEHLAVDSNSEVSTVQDVKWSSSNESIATVDEKGVITAHAPGEVSITASSLDKCCPEAKSELKITVTEPEQETQVTPQANAITIDTNISVSTSGNDLTINSNSPLGKIDIYSIDGKLVKSLNSTINVETVSLPSNGIYIVKTSTQTIKINL
ncbi:MAG: leucine-rich repeat protein [Paramuribaculum sp.]|nr:leucine-rich repeat protein [Paramuribaculum sp.]